jgi:hypothetical protein
MSGKDPRHPVHQAATQAQREERLPAVPRSTQIRPQGDSEQGQITTEYRIAYEYHGTAMDMPVAGHVSAYLLEQLGAQPGFANLRLQSRVVTEWSDTDGADSHAEAER